MYFENYEESLRNLPFKERYQKTDLVTEDFLYEKDGKVEVYWAPFEYINKQAKVIILGITPGFTQMELAFRYVRQHLDQEDYEELISHAKDEGSFGGTMRNNLIEMLDGIGLPAFLNINSSEELFQEENHLLHTTSILRYPVFIDGENYSGSHPKIFSQPIFMKMMEELLVPELNQVKDAVIVPTGKVVSDVLRYLVDEGKILNRTILFDFPHPSGANGHRKEQYEKNKAFFQEQLESVAESYRKKDKITFTPDNDQMSELIAQLRIIGQELKRANDLREGESYYKRKLDSLVEEVGEYDPKIALVIEHFLK